MDDVDSQDMPDALIEECLQRERGTLAPLNELEKLSIEGEFDRLRDWIRTFARNNREVFHTLALALIGRNIFLMTSNHSSAAGQRTNSGILLTRTPPSPNRSVRSAWKSRTNNTIHLQG